MGVISEINIPNPHHPIPHIRSYHTQSIDPRNKHPPSITSTLSTLLSALLTPPPLSQKYSPATDMTSSSWRIRQKVQIRNVLDLLLFASSSNLFPQNSATLWAQSTILQLPLTSPDPSHRQEVSKYTII